MWNSTEFSLIGATMQAGYWDHNGWSWMIGFHWLTWLLLISLSAAILIASFRLATRDVGTEAVARTASSSETRMPGHAALDGRYARGEIDRSEYLERKRDLS